jgi:hypothetical protein
MSSPEEGPQHLCFLIDTTGSMGEWISALNKSLADVLEMTTLLRPFELVSVLNYDDYDTSDHPYSFSGWCPSGSPKLLELARSLTPRGGGGIPEAFKTATKFLLENLPSTGTVHVLHLTDAPPHIGKTLDKEGRKEEKALGKLFDFYSLLYAYREPLQRVIFSSLTSCYSPEAVALYVYFAHRTGGHVHEFRDRVEHSAIRSAINNVFNCWFGLSDSNTGKRVWVPPNQFDWKNIVSDAGILNINASLVTAEEIPSRPALAQSVNRAVVRMKVKGNEEWVEHVCSSLRRIAGEAPMALTANPLLGKLWRAFCARRSDPRRDEILSLFQQSTAKLGVADKTTCEAWLKDSYDAKAEIHEELVRFIRKNGVSGIVRYDADQLFAPQAVAQSFLTLDAESMENLTNVLARLTVDETLSLQPTRGPEEDEEEEEIDPSAPLGIPANSLPLNLPIGRLLGLLMHMAAPGTKLSDRPGAILAVLGVKIGCVLESRMKDHLTAIKGQWINLRRRMETEGTPPEVPENFNLNFVNLVSRLNEQTEILSRKEADLFAFVKQVGAVLRHSRMESNVEVFDWTSINGNYPDYVLKCVQCSLDRSFTLIATDGRCGYCHSNVPTEKRPARPPPCNPESSFQVLCVLCKGLYGRDSSIYISDRSKCHFCRLNVESPCVECNDCKNKFVTEAKLFPQDGVDKCAACIAGMAPRRLKCLTHKVATSKILPLDQFYKELYGACGLEADQPVEGTIVSALLKLRRSTSEGPDSLPANREFTYRETPIVNIQQVWDQTILAMRGKAVGEKPQCSLCCAPSDMNQLAFACGRRKCVQRLCGDCGKGWYGALKVGENFFPRHMLCPFCGRQPDRKSLVRWNSSLRMLRGLQFPPDQHYAWCRTCLTVRSIGDHDCMQEAPHVTNFQCSDCSNKDSKGKVHTMECPKCKVTVEKISGCNHITCGCGAHWCWKCGKDFATSGETYAHLEAEHGGAWDGANFVWDADEYWSNDEDDDN